MCTSWFWVIGDTWIARNASLQQYSLCVSVNSVWGSCVAMQITFATAHTGTLPSYSYVGSFLCATFQLRWMRMIRVEERKLQEALQRWRMSHHGSDYMVVVTLEKSFFFCFLEFPVGRESNWDVKHRSSSTLGLMDGNVFTVYLWPGLLEGRVQLPKGTNRDIYQFLTCSICSGWLLWLQPDPFKYHNYS